MPHRRSIYFISDRTGITTESLGSMLLTQFEMLEFKRETIPFIDTTDKAQAVAERICNQAKTDHLQPIVFSSIVDKKTRKLVTVDCAHCIDFFDAFIGDIENVLSQKSSLSVGKTHGMLNEDLYDERINAVNFSLTHDDGIQIKDLDKADVVLVGVSRSGKTPTCLYLAIQYGICAANYPLTPDDLDQQSLPKILLPYQNKLFGLTIDPTRLHNIRNERRPDSRYASPENCRREVSKAESMFHQNKIPFLSTTHKSIEEIAAKVMHNAGLQRQF